MRIILDNSIAQDAEKAAQAAGDEDAQAIAEAAAALAADEAAQKPETDK